MPGPVSSEFPLWGGRAVVVVTEPGALDEALSVVQDVVEDVDRACSSFRPDSELTALNESTGRPVRVSPLLFEYLSAAIRAAEVTEGDVDPTIGEVLVALGFTEPGPAGRLQVRAVPGYRALALNAETGTACLARGVRVDLGATAKALAADRAATTAHQKTGAGVLVGLSGDLSMAGDCPDGGWRVRVTDDHRASLDAAGQWISLTGGGLATSSTTVRRHRAGGEDVHHVIDPATARPVRARFRTVSVAAASCLDANIASTAAIVRGERATAWLQALRLPSRLVELGGRVRHLAGWPEDGEDLPLSAPVVAA